MTLTYLQKDEKADEIIVCIVLLLPYAVVCALHACKYFLDPWFTDNVLGRRFRHTMWNPSLFLYELEHLAVPLLEGGATSTSTHIRATSGCLLGSGCFGGLTLALFGGSLSYLLYTTCLLLLLLSVFYFLSVVPYLVFTSQLRSIGQPLGMVGMGAISIAYYWACSDKFLSGDNVTDKYRTFLYLVSVLLLFLEAAIICWMHSNAPKIASAVEKFHLIKNHFMENDLVWNKGEEYPAGYSDSRLLLSV